MQSRDRKKSQDDRYAEAWRMTRSDLSRTESPRKHLQEKKGMDRLSDRVEYVENLRGVLKSFWKDVGRQSEIQRTQSKFKK